MAFGLKKKTAAKGSFSVDLFDQCNRLFAENFSLAREDTESCSDYILTLADPAGRRAYELCLSDNPCRSFGLFPEGKYAGHGSFIDPDGGFLQHGRITEADAAHILSAYTPVAGK